jgi:hypothetical protein
VIKASQHQSGLTSIPDYCSKSANRDNREIEGEKRGGGSNCSL